MRDESLAPEKLCIVFFGSGKLKIAMKCHAAWCMCQYYASNSYQCVTKFEFASLRLLASALGKKNLQTCNGKQF